MSEITIPLSLTLCTIHEARTGTRRPTLRGGLSATAALPVPLPLPLHAARGLRLALLLTRLPIVPFRRLWALRAGHMGAQADSHHTSEPTVLSFDRP